jgi:hypothetical protein
LKSRIPQTLQRLPLAIGILDFKLAQIAKGGLWSVCGILDLKLTQIAKSSLWNVCGILDFKLRLKSMIALKLQSLPLDI